MARRLAALPAVAVAADNIREKGSFKARALPEPGQAQAEQQPLAARADLISTLAARERVKANGLPEPEQAQLEPKLRESAAAPKDVIPANHSKGKALALAERERAPREPEPVAGAEVSILASIRAKALKVRKPAQADPKLAPTFRAGPLKVVRRADKAPVAEKAVTRGSEHKDRRYGVGRKAAREA
jgi:hypothetical protein